MQAIIANGFIFLSGTPGTANTTIQEQTAEVRHGIAACMQDKACMRLQKPV